jgi:hypothetical protein
MLSLVYVSTVKGGFSAADLVALLEQSREKNARLGITGMLLYKDGNFMQVLEGPDDVVRQLVKTIYADDRHHGVIQLLEWQIEQRQFPDWTMGFKDLNDPALRENPGYSEFMNQPLDSQIFRTEPSKARKLLEIFRRNAG